MLPFLRSMPWHAMPLPPQRPSLLPGHNLGGPTLPRSPWRGDGWLLHPSWYTEELKCATSAKGRAGSQGGDSHHATPQHTSVLCSLEDDDTGPTVPCPMSVDAASPWTCLILLCPLLRAHCSRSSTVAHPSDSTCTVMLQPHV